MPQNKSASRRSGPGSRVLVLSCRDFLLNHMDTQNPTFFNGPSAAWRLALAAIHGGRMDDPRRHEPLRKDSAAASSARRDHQLLAGQLGGADGVGDEEYTAEDGRDGREEQDGVGETSGENGAGLLGNGVSIGTGAAVMQGLVALFSQVVSPLPPREEQTPSESRLRLGPGRAQRRAQPGAARWLLPCLRAGAWLTAATPSRADALPRRRERAVGEPRARGGGPGRREPGDAGPCAA